MTTKSKKQHVSHHQLSDDLIIHEILTRLPIKSVVRFKSVSKQWYSTLSSPNFANAHLTKSPLSRPSAPVNTLFILYGNESYLFSYDDDQVSSSNNHEDAFIKLDVEFGVEQYMRLTGFSNGLVCLTDAVGEDFVLWNPATRKLHKYSLNCCSKGFHQRRSSGFGYASSVDDYKYVRISTENGFGEKSTTTAHIFSLKENKWRKVEIGNGLFIFTHSVLVNEKLYWGADSTQAGDIVLSFDLGDERFNMIKMNEIARDVLGVMGGCLSKCNYEDDSDDQTCRGDKFLVSMLEPPKTLKSIGGLPKELRLDTYSQMIGFTKADKFFVTGPSIDCEEIRLLGLVDTRTKPMQYTTILRFDLPIYIARYFPSLVSPSPVVELAFGGIDS